MTTELMLLKFSQERFQWCWKMAQTFSIFRQVIIL
jgi:hypothetical protein